MFVAPGDLIVPRWPAGRQQRSPGPAAPFALVMVATTAGPGDTQARPFDRSPTGARPRTEGSPAPSGHPEPANDADHGTVAGTSSAWHPTPVELA